MRMLRWPRSKKRKEHIKNEDIWREANIENMIGLTYIRKRRLRWYSHILSNGGGIPRDVKHASAGKEKKVMPKKRWLDGWTTSEMT